MLMADFLKNCSKYDICGVKRTQTSEWGGMKAWQFKNSLNDFIGN
jgi:hypothetical protein